MSYHIIKSIKLDEKNKTVFITGSDNNVVPRTPRKWENTYLKNIWEKEGKQATEISILEAYESGTFQGGNNKYSKALKILRNMQNFHDFCWRTNWENYRKNQETRSDEWNNMLITALNSKLPKEKFIILKTQPYSETKIYMKKRKNASFCRWTPNKNEATKFDYKSEAENIKDCFNGSDNWEIEQYI